MTILLRYGTSGPVEALEEMGYLPLKKWEQGRWQAGASRISGTALRETIYSGDYACKTCVIGCGKEVAISQGKYAGVSSAAAEHETVGTLGALCLVDDLEEISYANELCNRFGIDTISTGSAIAFAMEACEKGIICCEDHDVPFIVARSLKNVNVFTNPRKPIKQDVEELVRRCFHVHRRERRIFPIRGARMP